jgi:hypothetical protein
VTNCLKVIILKRASIIWGVCALPRLYSNALSFEEEEELAKEQKAVEARALKKEQGEGGGEGEEEAGELYCIVCRKRFKNKNTWRNHERSKKHLELVAALKAQVRSSMFPKCSPNVL